MKDPNPVPFLDDIILNMKLCLEFTKGLSFKDFCEKVQTQYAVTRALEIIGEAVKKLPENLRDSNDLIPWKSMAGMRDRLIHGYDNINLELVYLTASKSIPALLPKVESLLIHIKSEKQ